MATNAYNNKNLAGNSVEGDSFIIEEYKTIRDEIKATKARLFLINSVGIAGVPMLLSWLAKDDSNSISLMIFECFLPFIVVASIPVFLSENRNLMRCGRYIRKHIENELTNTEKYHSHIGWERWLETNNKNVFIPNEEEISIPNEEEIDNKNQLYRIRRKVNKIYNRINSLIDLFLKKAKYFLYKNIKTGSIFNDKNDFDKRSVDRLVIRSFLLLFIVYYASSATIAMYKTFAVTHNRLSFISLYLIIILMFSMYSTLGRLILKYSAEHYHDLISTKHHDATCILSFDIGGTNSRVLTCYINEEIIKSGSNAFEGKTNSYQKIDELLIKSDINNNQYDRAIVAVPGAVTTDNLIHLPYVRWKTIDQAALKRRYRKIIFINDFVAQAYGCLTEAIKGAVLISGKEQQKRGDIAVIGAGTGTGHCSLKKIDADSYACIPSEAGHIPFPFLFDDEIESGFREFLISTKNDADHTRDNLIPVCNDVVSGTGLSRLHQFITNSERELLPSEVAEEIKSDPNSDTTKYFGKFYGRACRNYVLSTLASGGTLYISGGVAIKNPFLVDNQSFKDEFRESKTTAGTLLEQISVYLIQDERIGLLGAAYYGAKIA